MSNSSNNFIPFNICQQKLNFNDYFGMVVHEDKVGTCADEKISKLFAEILEVGDVKKALGELAKKENQAQTTTPHKLITNLKEIIAASSGRLDQDKITDTLENLARVETRSYSEKFSTYRIKGAWEFVEFLEEYEKKFSMIRDNLLMHQHFLNMCNSCKELFGDCVQPSKKDHIDGMLFSLRYNLDNIAKHLEQNRTFIHKQLREVFLQRRMANFNAEEIVSFDALWEKGHKVTHKVRLIPILPRK